MNRAQRRSGAKGRRYPRPALKGNRRALCAMRDIALAGYPELVLRWRPRSS